MIKSNFTSVFGAEAIAAFQRQYHLRIEALDNSAGITRFGLEIVACTLIEVKQLCKP